MSSYVLSLDQGISSSRAILFDQEGAPVAEASREFPQLYPQAGWVEHDPEELWSSQLDAAHDVLARAAVEPSQVAAVGITNQRETTVVWERASGRPLCNAIVWQCRRTAPMCEQMRRRGLEPLVRERTGLIIDAYFSATKLRWILDHVPGAGPLNGGARDLRGLTEAAGAETREVTAHLQEVAMKLALVAAGQRLPGRVMSGLL
jgi:glycerol kinase